MLFDNHTHSQFSFDAKGASVEGSSMRAWALGLGGITFTDHFDIYLPQSKALHGDLGQEDFDIGAQQEEILRAGAEFREKGREFKILRGIELGVYGSAREQLSKTLRENTFDCVIASCHYLDDTDPYWGEYYEGKGWKEAFGHYLETLYSEMVWLGDRFDVMGHYDYIVRYAPYKGVDCIRLKDFEILDEILRFLAQGGKALEINTRSYVADGEGKRKVAADPMVLRRFKELGGEAISMGSDAHRVEDVGRDFGYFRDYLRSEGWRYAVHFEDRKAVFGKI